MDEQIIQIIPAPVGLVAYYTDENCIQGTCNHKKDEPHSASGIPVVCLALVKVGNDTDVLPMIMTKEGYSEFATDSDNFVFMDQE